MREYMALFQEKTKPDTPRIKRLKNMIISPTEKGSFLSQMMASISVPSRDPPQRIMSPTPMPIMMPPKMVDKKGSFVTGSKWMKRLQTASHKIEYKEATVK